MSTTACRLIDCVEEAVANGFCLGHQYMASRVGWQRSPEGLVDEDEVFGRVSVADDTIDQMVEDASVPNLASLFKKAKDKGIITTVPGQYGG